MGHNPFQSGHSPSKTHTYLPRQRDSECGADIRFAFSPYRSAVEANNSLHDSKAHPCPAKLFLRVKPLEDIEQFVLMLHVEAGTIILDEVDVFTCLLNTSDFDYSLGPVAGELEARWKGGW